MAWPQVIDYNEALQWPQHCFASPELQQGQVACNALGLPMPCTGGFAAVYKIASPGEKTWAVKCFTHEVDDLQQRYRALSEHLQQIRKTMSLPFIINFDYQEKGILINGRWYPILKMSWVEGQTFNEFVRNSLRKPDILSALSSVWLRLARDLRTAQIAHGDLQHGNVLLVQGARAGSVRPKLIDYDGMIVPSLAEQKSGEVGHPNYQHPQRLREGTYDNEVDRFSHLVIVTALQSLLVHRKLWEYYNNDENLLFRAEDFQAPATSPLFQDLWKLPPGNARTLAGHLLLATQLPMEQVPLLEELFQGDECLPLTEAQNAQIESILESGRDNIQEVPRRREPPPEEVQASVPWWVSQKMTGGNFTPTMFPANRSAVSVTPSPLPAVSPVPPLAPPSQGGEIKNAPPSPVQQAEEYASQSKIDVTLRATTSFPNKESALVEAEKLQAAYPVVVSAYQSSGKVPAEAHKHLFLGALVGSLIGLVIVVLFELLIAWLIEAAVRVSAQTFLMSVLVGLLAVPVVLFVLWLYGIIAANLIGEMSRKGKNRSPSAAAFYSFGSVLFASMVGFLLFWISPYHSSLIWLECLAVTIFVGVAVGVSRFLVEQSVRTEKFCETCEIYMARKRLDPVCLGGLQLILFSLQQKNVAAVAGTLDIARFGHTAQPDVYSCQFCGQGYLEIHFHFFGTWTSGKQGKKHEAGWLVASQKLTADEVFLFNS